MGLMEDRGGTETGWRGLILCDPVLGPNQGSARTRTTSRTGPSQNQALNPQWAPNPILLGRGPVPYFLWICQFGRMSGFEAGFTNPRDSSDTEIKVQVHGISGPHMGRACEGTHPCIHDHICRCTCTTAICNCSSHETRGRIPLLALVIWLLH